MPIKISEIETGTVRGKVLKFLRDGAEKELAFTAVEIADELEISRGNINSILAKLKQGNKVSHSHQHWFLKSAEECE